MCISLHLIPTYLADKLNFDPLVLQPLPGVLQCDIHLPTDSFTIVEKKIFVFLSIFSLVLSLLPRFSVIQDHIDFGTLSKTEETHGNVESVLCQLLSWRYCDLLANYNPKPPANVVFESRKQTQQGLQGVRPQFLFRAHNTL